MADVRLFCGDCLAVLPTLQGASVDAVVTDPPAGISFMGASWDSFGGRCNGNAERDRAAGKGRGPVCAKNPHGKNTQPFGYSGSSLPAGPDQRSAFIAFLTAALAECLRVTKPGGRLLCWAIPRTSHWTGTAVEDAGWVIEDRISHLFGQGFPKGKSKLKPACEDWWLARKPGPRVLPLPGLDGCRVPCEERPLIATEPKNGRYPGVFGRGSHADGTTTAGRYPANVVIDGSPEVLEAFAAFGEGKSNWRENKGAGLSYSKRLGPEGARGVCDTGTAARFYYCAKASKSERGSGNNHPTVKPLKLCEWLVRLVCPPGGTVLDPFAGSGTTGVACVKEGFGFIGIEQDAAYVEIARARLAARTAEDKEAAPLFTEVS
jgi:DNA modification methylase